ncbi:DUF4203 domain-containing protein [Chloroflexota bacterium]
MTGIIQAVLGAVLLLAGRKLYWLFVGIVGFVIGISLAQSYLPGEQEIVLLVLALIAGGIGALLALFLQRVAVGAAGFLAGGYAAMVVLEIFQLQLGIANWVVYLVAGLIGSALVAALFDWALIILASLTGAGMLVTVELFNLNEWIKIFLLVFLFIIGVGVQAAGMREDRRRSANSDS